MGSRNHHHKSGEKSVFQIINNHFGRLMLLGNILVLAWLYICCAITWIPCDEHPYLSLVALTFPIALFLNILFFAFWLVLNVRRLWVPFVGILLCMGYVLDYCPLNLSESEEPEGLKIVSWNTKSLGGPEGSEFLRNYLKNSDADIICLQEASFSGGVWEDFVAQMQEMGYEFHNQKSLALFTRLHLLQSDTLNYETRSNVSFWYLLACKDDTILVVNNHLESNRLSPELKQEYADVLDNPRYGRAKESGRTMLSMMAESAQYRGNQARVLRDFVEQNSNHHVIVCGDFNETPISYVCQTLERSLTSAYRDSGHGVGVSFREKGFWVRIDHIFFSRDGVSQNTHIDHTIDVSDHFPIVSWVNFKQNQQ